MIRFGSVVCASLVLWAVPVAAEWHLKPFAGVTFGGSTTLVDLEHAAGKVHLITGVTGTLIGEVLGVDADLGWARGFFQTGGQELVLASNVVTLTGNVVIAVPRRMAQYSLRPYFVAGVGLMHARSDGRLGALPVSSTLPAVDFGGGATGFLTSRLGLNWEIRRFGTVGGGHRTSGVSFDDERLSFWRASMAIAVRYGGP